MRVVSEFVFVTRNFSVAHRGGTFERPHSVRKTVAVQFGLCLGIGTRFTPPVASSAVHAW
jgi:hypothetical protein